MTHAGTLSTCRANVTLWTIGHSTRPIDEFLALLQAHHIEQLVDVRTVPRSRRNPQFDSLTLAASLAEHGLAYRHCAGLGGLRKARRDSPNAGWRNASFRGYADYMQTEPFESALEDLMVMGRTCRTVIMCAEAVPWRCHRSLIGDALVVPGWTVLDILTDKRAEPHALTGFAQISDGRLRYPAPTDERQR